MLDNKNWSIISYKTGSYITVKDKPSKDIFYIIKKGHVKVSQSFIININTTIGPGDLINIVSALAEQTCDETNYALTDVEVISINKNTLPILIKKNTSIALKILQIFSKKIRLYNHTLEMISTNTTAGIKDESMRMYETALFYFKEERQHLAKYAFSKFLSIYPETIFTSEVNEYLNTLKHIDIKNQENNNLLFLKDSSFVFCENEAANDTFYIIRTGHIKITKISHEKETLFAVLGPGDIFGEMAILENKPRSANAISIGDTIVVGVKETDFSNFIKEEPNTVIKLMNILANRIWVMSKNIENIVIKKPIGKMYETLITLIKKEHIELENNVSYSFEFSFKDLANMASIPTDIIDDVIREIEEEGVVVEEGERIVVTDLERLASIAKYHKRMSNRDFNILKNK